uniref:Reverse transcriptase domain-containing protein n=1 Tax=Amphimedon queenslandica TaxID=400682 RepID=A0A1X7VH02_AMPQE
LDMSRVYQQLELDYDSKCFTVINTHKAFSHIISLLQDIPKVAVYIDDILIPGKSHTEHSQTVERLFCRLHDAGLHLKKKKCNFCTSFVQYLCFSIDKDGLQPTAEKIRAIKKAPMPTNITQFKTYL